MIDELLEAWRATRDPRLEAAIAREGRGSARGLPHIGLGLRGKKREALWCETALAAPASELDRVLDAEWPVHWEYIRERAIVLGKRAPDPRIARKLVSVGRWNTAPAMRSMHEAIVATLVHCASPTVLPWLEVLTPTALYAQVREAAGSGEVEPAHAELWREVYRRPDLVEPRSVLADALLADDDPRGEFIQLQLATDPDERIRKRIARLLRHHGSEWIGPLPNIENEDLVFARGFPVTLISTATEDRIEPTIGRPEWRTLEALQMGSTRGTLPRLLANLPVLERFETGDVELLDCGSFPSVRVVGATDRSRISRGTFPGLRVLATNTNNANELARALGVSVVVHRGWSYDIAQLRDNDVAETRFTHSHARFLRNAGWLARTWRDRSDAELVWLGTSSAWFPTTLHEQLLEAGITSVRVQSAVPVQNVPEGIEVGDDPLRDAAEVR